ncbi:chemotaxis protein [Pseudomonas syringae]|uniref:Chemotaxis protein n=2 Tax=Pseudomonas syringae TaxID=317 RepID=A0A085VM34_PSESX|nr:methyl-accepting chemotaxis protein [Pseudomonas syringae]KFE56497.1 chemotaxis protein [Pseudomonas syringae]
MSIRNLKISGRASLFFGVIVSILVGIGVFSYLQLGHLRSASQVLEENALPSTQVIDDIQIALLSARLESIRLLANTNELAKEAAESKVRAALESMKKNSDYYRSNLIYGEQDRAQFSEAEDKMNAYIDGLFKLLNMNETDHEKALVFANTEQAERASAFQEKLTIIRKFIALQAKELGSEAAASYQRSLQVLIVVIVSALVLTVFLAVTLTHSIVKPITESLEFAEEIASGNLSRQLMIVGDDEASRLMVALNVMASNLRSTIQEISGASMQLSTAAVEMMSVTEDADRVLQQQNSEIEQAATAVNEMTSAIEEVARNAASTSEAARGSSASADIGNERVAETLAAMEVLTGHVENSSVQVLALAEQAQDISKVLSVIRGIAEQTNLLALNAAIEAARAGEQGRGFAVVADEVRALAHRTQISTQEIEQMIAAIQSGSSITVEAIQKSTDEVQNTRITAEGAGDSLRLIASSVLEINNRNIQIAAASEEQAYVARDVDRSLISIRNLAIQSSDGAHQTMTASNELSKLAIRLTELVKQFKV